MTELNIKECVQVSQMGRKEEGFLSRRDSWCRETGGETGCSTRKSSTWAEPLSSLRWVITIAS